MRHLLYYGTVLLALTAAVFIAPAPPDVKAVGCRTSACATTYYAPDPEYIYVDRVVPVAYPVPYTVAVPVVSYIWNGGAAAGGYSPVYAAQPAVMGNVQTQAPQATTHDTGAPKTSALLQLTDQEIDLLIDRIEKRLTARAVDQLPNGRNPSVGSPPPPVPQDRPGRQSWSDADVLRVLSTPLGKDGKSCMSCHTGSTAKAGVRIFDSPGILSVKANWSKIWDAADSGRMPPAAAKDQSALVSDLDCEILKDKMLKTNGGR